MLAEHPGQTTFRINDAFHCSLIAARNNYRPAYRVLHSIYQRRIHPPRQDKTRATHETLETAFEILSLRRYWAPLKWERLRCWFGRERESPPTRQHVRWPMRYSYSGANGSDYMTAIHLFFILVFINSRFSHRAYQTARMWMHRIA